MKEYAIVFEQGPEGWSAYAPDLPGLGAAGTSFDEVQELIREAIQAHIDCLRDTGNPVPEPTTRVAVMSAAA
jgi:predicted RNase H-like HicB family nuclease